MSGSGDSPVPARASQRSWSAAPASVRLPGLLPDDPAAGPASLGEHMERYGPLPCPGSAWHSREALIATVASAGLTGRGGAGFPTARKLAAVAAGTGPVVLANGTEGEPASAKDKVLLSRSPHLVLDGAVLAAEIVGARQAVIVAHPGVCPVVGDAAAERERAGSDRVRIQVVTAGGRFVGGEASAVANWVGRRIPAPTARPPRLSERGLNGRPTLVQNVETLAHLALIARYGASWFRSAGPPQQPGTMLVTILGAVREPGVREVAVGTRIGAVLGLAGGPSAPLSALLLGGYSGSWADAGDAMGRPFSLAGLADLGAGVGAGLIAALPAHACGLSETARVTRYLAHESSGQCGPCAFGLSAIADEIARIAQGCAADTGMLRRQLGQAAGRGACGHPDGAVRLVRSALTTFRSELDLHARGWCSGNRRVLPLPSARPANPASVQAEW